MNDLWLPTNTTTHQDHVIAHLVGTSVLAYFIVDDAVHLLLDIGFIWKVYVDGEMGLLPHPIAIAELEVTDKEKQRIAADVELLLRHGIGARPLVSLSALSSSCSIEDVEIFKKERKSKLVVLGEDSDLELSVAGDSITVAEI